MLYAPLSVISRALSKDVEEIRRAENYSAGTQRGAPDPCDPEIPFTLVCFSLFGYMPPVMLPSAADTPDADAMREAVPLGFVVIIIYQILRCYVLRRSRAALCRRRYAMSIILCCFSLIDAE